MYVEVISVDKEILKGSIDILLLTIISKRDTYGYEIIQELKKHSKNEYNMSQGTLYPALKRMEKKEFIESYWGESETGMRRKFYRITVSGRSELKRKLTAWEQITNLINACGKGALT
jgi:PadR family transcriptional regulator, regulatory protein PadR